MRIGFRVLVWFVIAMGLAACAPAAPLPPADSGPRIHTVLVVSNGWHAAIVMARAEAAATGLLPEAADFPQAAFLEFGWGDRDFYPAAEPSLGVTLGAALTATPAVMHLAGLARAPAPSLAEPEVVPVALSQDGLRRLIGAIAGTFERPAGGRAQAVSRGLYPDSFFYNARGTFYLFNTCNTWIARMLRAGGVNISPSGIVTADELMARLRAALAKEGDLG